MAESTARSSARCAMWFPISCCLDCGGVPYCNLDWLGLLADCYIGSTYHWTCDYNGWNSAFTGVLLNHALVEDTVAKLKYVCSLFYLTFLN